MCVCVGVGVGVGVGVRACVLRYLYASVPLTLRSLNLTNWKMKVDL